jgi:hypothetical protein
MRSLDCAPGSPFKPVRPSSPDGVSVATMELREWERCFLVHKLLARGAMFRGREFTFPGGRIVWVRFSIPGERLRMHVEWAGEEPPILDPPEGSEDWLDTHPEAGRLVILAEDDRTAVVVGDAIGAMLALLHGALGMHYPAIEIPAEWVERGEILAADFAAVYADRRVPLEERLHPRTGVWVPDRALFTVLEHLDALVSHGDGKDRGALAAVVFWRLSTEDYAFEGDDIGEVLAEPDEGPRTPFDQAQAEQCFQNAYKALEALLGGQPSKDEAKLRARLVDAGVDPNRVPRLPDETATVLQRVMRFREVRDTKAAHGGRTAATSRQLTYFDLMEAQWVVGEMIVEVLGIA